MTTEDSIRLSGDGQRHQEVMRNVAIQIQHQDESYILKGGTALALTRGSSRYSVDLDFDSERKLNIEDRILKGLECAGVEMLSLNKVKDTDIAQKFKIHYCDPKTNGNTDEFLRVETSFRITPNPALVETINGIRTYDIDTLFGQKLDAMTGRTRPRDLVDLLFLVRTHGEHISHAQLNRAEVLTSDFIGLAERYDVAFHKNEVLSAMGNAEDLVMEFRIMIEKELNRYGLASGASQAAKAAKQANPEVPEYPSPG